MERINVRLPDRLLAALTERAAEEHRDISSMVRHILSLELGISDGEDLNKEENPELPLP